MTDLTEGGKDMCYSCGVRRLSRHRFKTMPLIPSSFSIRENATGQKKTYTRIDDGEHPIFWRVLVEEKGTTYGGNASAAQAEMAYNYATSMWMDFDVEE